MRSLVLAERPYRDLRSRALLQDLPALIGATSPLMLAKPGASVPKGFEPMALGTDPASLGVSRVVLAGVFQERALLDQALAVAAEAMAAGALLEVRRFGVERSAAQRMPPQLIALLDQAGRIELRDHHTANALLVWRVAAAFRIDPYPERRPPPDPALLGGLPEFSPVLGLGILGGPQMRAAWMEQAEALHAALAPMRGWPVLPLPCEAPGSPMDDFAGSRDFRADIMPEATAAGAAMLLPELADPDWRRRHLTPSRLKALVARCGAVVTNQDLPAAFAVACGVKVIGLALGGDRRVVSCLTQFANHLPAGSTLLYAPSR